MIKNYFKITFRTLWKNKGYTFINILGLSVAFCISAFLFLTAYFQLSFDSFHADGDRIFQMYFFSNAPEKPERSSSMPFPLTPALKTEFPEIEGVARFVHGSNVVEFQDVILEKQIKYTDPDFLNIFSFPLLQGDKDVALRDLSSMIITENMAKDLFGNQNPMGKQVSVGLDEGRKQYVITGVLADFPENSSLQFDAFLRAENYGGFASEKDQWDAHSHQVFLKLSPKTNQEAFEKRLKPFVKKYFSENQSSLIKQGAKPDEQGDIFAMRLQKLANVHFNTDISGSSAPQTLIFALIGIALFILLIACINFINLNVARSFIRAREVGVRKSLGAVRGQLFTQIWGEAAMVCVLGFVVGLVLTAVFLPQFNATFQGKLTLDYMLQPDKVALMLGVLLFVTLLAGGYPAWLMSRFNTVEVLKGKVSLKKPGLLRNSLMVIQFSLSSLLVCCTIIAIQQVNHLREQPLGFQKEQVISIPVGNKVNGNQALQRMRNLLANDPSVEGISGSGVNLGVGLDRSTSRSVIGFSYKGKEVTTDWLQIDYDFMKTLNIKLLAGREFNATYPSDTLDRVIITESMAKMIGEDDPVGKFFQTDTAGTKYQIIGLVPDFNLYSSKNEKKPITMFLSQNPVSYIFIRVTPQSLSGVMDKFRNVWKEVAPQAEFKGSFVDENTDAWYRSEERFAQIFSLASGIAILLSCLGLFAIALIVIEQRTKEIGIRKVLGASIGSLVFSLSRDFVKLVLLASLIATPLAWYFMREWLSSYPYRIEINPWIFAGVAAAALLVAVGTVSFQSIKAALMNPVKSLRSE
ncbi:ABC transporter permease [Arundinibacter roseus]|uniref:ABC transporter permease n=1 Tax=Arundinibacter roseus TaxID=2070510 RepID=A0A4R4KGC6_9BACT|nr:ABC transporter permease [Arundinibacter roseus]TDB65916.1 ABC transporter permease [Arundinibacter roseus]